MKKFNILIVSALSLIIASCASNNSAPTTTNEAGIESPTIPSSYDGHYKVGNPYTINGVTYKPREYRSYKKRGMASWYGDYYHGKKTANGETYNMHDLTAAHNTLPLPSIARVTNLSNGKVIIVRVNDRGPFAKNRIIDLSKKSAQTLGFTRKGLTKVEVKLLTKETAELHKALNLK